MSISHSDIERAHRIGRYSALKPRPTLVAFSSYKTKQKVLLQGRKLKETSYAMSEDYSAQVRLERRHIISFAKKQTHPFKLRFKRLNIGNSTYIFDNEAKEVVQCNS